MDLTEASIAAPHWDACLKCKHFDENRGCDLPCIDLSLYMNEWILCDDFERPDNNQKT